MASSYCGKDCASCPQRTSSCPGCKDGPGRSYACECEIARCCRDKGHENCTTCLFSSGCATLRRRESLFDQRLQKRQAEEEQTQKRLRDAAFAGKWIWVLFWLVVAGIVADLGSIEPIALHFPTLSFIGEGGYILCNLAYGAVLLKLFPVNERYRTAGIFSLITQVLQGLFLLLWGNAAPSWSLIFTLPALGISLLGNFHEFHAHSELLWGLDSLLAEKWERLWTWNIASTGIFIGGTVLALLIDVVGLLLALAGTIGMLAVSILTPIYLYQTAKALTYSVATAAEQ